MLSRSKTAPLHLKVLLIPLAEQPIPSAVLPFPERLRSLTWCDNADHLFTLVKPAPFVESVNIRLQLAAPLPVDFLGGDAPRLRSFYARNVYVHVDPSSLSNIRILSLGGQWHDPTTTLKLSAFLTFLRRLVHLEELSMDIPGAMEADVVDPSRNIVSHPTKKLDVNANRQWPIVRQFLESIRLDALRDIRVRSNAVYDSRELFPDDILKTILTFFKPGINAKPDTLKTSFSSEKSPVR
ncbi:hypothetical protein ONZ45_g15628 [Pleurotus djamor]|nr:hypothetical protein ONZ45_g15628 [Pleurotus djamor]